MIDDIKLSLTSADMTEALLAQLHTASPQIFSEGRVDFARLQAALGAHIDTNPERYGLTWAGKRDAFRNVQVPSVATLRPMPEESVNWDSSENLIIEGDNLEVLKLLQKPYHGKVKMIYIDPPYNTGNEFIYPDNFREGLDEYLRYTGQLGEDGTATSTNKDTSGRYHSNWLDMMYPRLFLARNLLREDGVIFVSIDDHEVHNLRLLMDEVFGEENFVACICWQHSLQPKGYTGKFSIHHNYHLLYRRSDLYAVSTLERTEEHNKNYGNPDDDPRGPWRTGDVRNALFRPNLRYDITSPSGKLIPYPENGWRWSKETVAEKIKSGEIIFSQDETRIIRKIYLSTVEGRVPESIWFGKEVGTTRDATSELKSLFDASTPFDTPKPTTLIRQMLSVAGVEADDIILDFFAGSGTTAHAVLDLNQEDGGNRKFILVQLPEKTDNPQYPTIVHITRERVRRVIAKQNQQETEASPQLSLTPGSSPGGRGELNPRPPGEGGRRPGEGDLGFRAFKLDSSNFKIWRSDNAPQTTEQLTEQLKLYANNVLAERNDQDRLYELILKSGRPLSARVERIPLPVRPELVEGQVAHASTSSARTAIYSVGDGDLLICLEPHLERDTLRALFARKPQMVLCLDVAFDGNDALKTNTVLEAQSHGIVFKTA